MINLSILNVPLNENVKLKDAMYITAQPLYKQRQIKWENLHKIVSSDYRQYSPFTFQDGIKKSENWSNKNQNVLILDIDDGLSIEQAKQKFSRYKYFICTTKSHQIEKKGVKCDRFRVFLLIENCPIGDEYFNYMRCLEDTFDFIDVQVNTKTGAFLGCSNCKYWYNDGEKLDMNIFKPLETNKKAHNRTETYQKQTNSYQGEIDIEKIKNVLSRETVADIVQSLGYEVNSKFKFKYRLDERTPSASISNSHNPIIKDFGSDLSTDIFGLVQENKKCNFIESVKYVASFVNVQVA